MPYQSRTPAIRLTVDVDIFNCLLERLSRNESVDDEVFKAKATKLKDKLLAFSVPRTDEDGKSIIDIRFFPNEASFLIEQLLVSNLPEEISTDFYSVLVKVREARLEERKNSN